MEVQDTGGSCHLFNRKEGVTQGDHLAVITFGIGILPLIHGICNMRPHVTQNWYADDTEELSHFDELQDQL